MGRLSSSSPHGEGKIGLACVVKKQKLRIYTVQGVVLVILCVYIYVVGCVRLRGIIIIKQQCNAFKDVKLNSSFFCTRF
jgi:hypothetical protein